MQLTLNTLVNHLSLLKAVGITTPTKTITKIVPVTDIIKEKAMSVGTWLEKAGDDVLNFFKKAAPVVQAIQTIATPFENIYAPGLASVINIGLTEIIQAEALAAAAGQTSGSGEVKLAAVTAALAPQIGPMLAALGINNPTTAQYTQFINGLVAAANAFQLTQVIVPTPTIPPVPTTVVLPAPTA